VIAAAQYRIDTGYLRFSVCEMFTVNHTAKLEGVHLNSDNYRCEIFRNIQIYHESDTIFLLKFQEKSCSKEEDPELRGEDYVSFRFVLEYVAIRREKIENKLHPAIMKVYKPPLANELENGSGQ